MKRRRKSSWCSSMFSATTSCGVMCVTPTSGSTSCGFPAASSADDSCRVCAATTLSSARPWINSSGRVSDAGQRQQRRVGVGGVVDRRVAEVALGVVRVVQPPVGDRRAGDRGVEHVGTPHHRERGEIATEAPAADRDTIEVERIVLGGGVQRVDLIVEDRCRQVEVDGALPLAAPSRRAASVDDRRRRSPDRRTTATARTGCATPARIARADRRTDRGAPAGETRRGRAAAARRSPGVDRRSGAATRWGRSAASSANDVRPGPPTTWVIDPQRIERRAAQHGRAAADDGGVNPDAVADLESGRRRSIPKRPAPSHRRAGCARNDHRVARAPPTNAAHLEIGRESRPRRRSADDACHRGRRPSPIVRRRARSGRSRHQLDPRVVVIGEDRRGVARRRVGLQHLQVALVAGLDGRATSARSTPSARR